MAWLYLIVAGLFEIAFALLLKLSEGFTRPLPTVGFLAAGGVSFYLLSLALRTLPVGTAYAVWTGIGAAGTAVFGMLFLGEGRGVLKLLSLLLVIVGLVGLRLTTEGH
jgi:quaternary ammonium compound-resistance protein SugE